MNGNQPNRFDFEFDPRIANLIDLVDEVFVKLHQPKLLENSSIEFNDIVLSPIYMIFAVDSPAENTVDLLFYLAVDSIRVDIDGNPETLEWSADYIEKTREKVVEFLYTILSGYIMIDTRGASRFIQIFDADGFLFHSLSVNNTLHLLTGTYLLKAKGYRRLYKPVFEK